MATQVETLETLETIAQEFGYRLVPNETGITVIVTGEQAYTPLIGGGYVTLLGKWSPWVIGTSRYGAKKREEIEKIIEGYQRAMLMVMALEVAGYCKPEED